MQLDTVTLEGIHFQKNGFHRADLPFTPEADAFGATWDADLSTLTYYTPNDPDAEGNPTEPTEHTREITESEIANAITQITAPKPPAVPKRVSKAQLKIALLGAGIDILTLIEDLPSERQPVARIIVQDADYFTRSASLVESFGTAAGLDSNQIDALFIAAGQIDLAAL